MIWELFAKFIVLLVRSCLEKFGVDDVQPAC